MFTLVNIRNGLLTALLVAALAGFAAPRPALAAEPLPSLEGTAYGDMMTLLEKRLAAFDGATGSAKADHQAALVKTLAKQNLTMIRMIDALHDQVNGLAEGEARRVIMGRKKFEGIVRSKAWE